MAGRGRGRATFPEVRNQLRQPIEDLLDSHNDIKGSSDGRILEGGDAPVQHCDDLKKLCFRLKYLDASSDPEFSKTMDSLRTAIKTKSDLNHAAGCIHELSQLGPEQAKITACAFAELADMEVEGSKLRYPVLQRMEADFKGYKEMAASAPKIVICNAIFLCKTFCQYLINGSPVRPLQVPVWEYLNFMLLSQKPFFIKYCLQMVQAHGSFLSRHCSTEMGSFLNAVRSIILDESMERHIRKLALETLEFSARGWKSSLSTMFYASDM